MPQLSWIFTDDRNTRILEWTRVIQTFADEGTYDIYVGTDSKAARRTLPKPLWPVARRKLHWIDAARDVDALRAPPGKR